MNERLMSNDSQKYMIYKYLISFKRFYKIMTITFHICSMQKQNNTFYNNTIDEMNHR